MSFSATAPPLFHTRSEKGRRSANEDRELFRVNFMEVPMDPAEMVEVIPKRLQTLMRPKSRTVSVGGDMSSCTSRRSAKSGELYGGSEAGTIETFHIFGVFDGHGGYRAAEHCVNKLAQNLKSTITRALKKHALPIKEIVRHKTVPTHVLLAEAVNYTELAGSDFEETEPDPSPFDNPSPETRSSLAEGSRLAAEEDLLFSTMSLGVSERFSFANEQRSIQTLVSQHLNDLNIQSNGLTPSQLESCLNDAFVMTDNQFDRENGAEESGTTALTALVSARLLCFANCGDCRAVLYRDGQILQVTREHSPEMEDEKQRIELLGGRIIAIRADGPRVMGVLNMTRSIGDFGLKPFIIPNPEVTIVRRCMYDDFVVIASDGLWGVLDNQEVCDLVLKCFDRVESREMARAHASKLATTVLIRKALDNGSPDNITVIVIDLRQYR